MHGEIIRYYLEGEISDSTLPTERERLVEFLETQMRDFGCVPSLDIQPQFTLDYKPEAESYDFSLSVYGVYVGEDAAWRVAGVTNGKRISRSTPRAR